MCILMAFVGAGAMGKNSNEQRRKGSSIVSHKEENGDQLNNEGQEPQEPERALGRTASAFAWCWNSVPRPEKLVNRT